MSAISSLAEHRERKRQERIVIMICRYTDMDIHSVDLRDVLCAAEERFPGWILWVRHGESAVRNELNNLAAYRHHDGAAACTALQVGTLRIQCLQVLLPLLQ